MPPPQATDETRSPGRLTLRLGVPAAGGRTWSHLVAARAVLTDAPLPPLAPFATGASAEVADAPAAGLALGPETPFYRGPGWVGGRYADVVCSRRGDAYVVRIAGLPAMLADRLGCRVLPAGGVRAELTDALTEAVVGPGLILPLALAGVFSLHAGAVAHGGRALLLLGESGAGKSTLARSLAAAPAFAPVADDVLPVEAAAAGLTALPHYPQLKLAAAAQWPLAAPVRLPVAAIVVLAPDTQGHAAVTLERVTAREAFLALSRHTVAARLFDTELLAAHAAFCAAAAERVPVHALAFPRRLDALPAMVEALAAHLATIAR